jgi:AmmeMemoRadiSam system protein B/AmmeMemoRadiSam system protein A
VQEANVAGSFYPADPQELSLMIDGFLSAANPQPVTGAIFALISPHAGYPFSGPTAAFGYKLIQQKPYKTVVVIGASHHFAFKGISVYPTGSFRTPLGEIEIDRDFAAVLMKNTAKVIFEPRAFQQEHSVEAQLPFLQKTLSGFRIVPVIMGDCDLQTCEEFGRLLAEATGTRTDVLIVASTDMYHGYDPDEARIIDRSTLDLLKRMDKKGLYDGLRGGTQQLCGGFAVISMLAAAKKLGHQTLNQLQYTTSADVTGRKNRGEWCVGYTSCVIDQQGGDRQMLNKDQKKKLLEIARHSIETYLKTGKMLEVKESDPALCGEMGAFVTLHERGQLRGCIGNLIGDQPLYLTIRDMAVESATGDPRFPPVRLTELEDIEIEISALSPLELTDSPDKIQMGVHGVLVKKGYRSGVYLPQVATETGWTRDEFLSSLCAHKAGLPADAWKDKATELYIFTASVFSEKELQDNK